VKLITALTCNDDSLFAVVRERLLQEFGPIDHQSILLNFTHTDYYRREMGAELKKGFLSFAQLIRPEALVDIKLRTNALEREWTEHGKRRVNVDPGYLEASKLVMATTKNLGHRVYLGQGIYADLQLRFRRGRFEPNEWTFPDYREPMVLDFFLKARQLFLQTTTS